MDAPAQRSPAGLLRRLAAGVYDLLLVAGLSMILGIAIVILRGGTPIAPGTAWFQALLLCLAGVFYAGFWSRGGQTLGMRSWRLRVEQCDGSPLDLRTALLRFAAMLLSLAAAGLGIAWILVDGEKRAWHDRLTGTRVVLLPKANGRP